MTVGSDHIQSLYDAQVLDSDGQKVGGVGQVYVDDQTGDPAWITVKTGLFGNNETFVPLQNANIAAGEVRVPYTKDFIKGAPNIDGEGHLDDGDQQNLFSYYSDGSNDRSAANEQLAPNDRNSAAPVPVGGAAGDAAAGSPGIATIDGQGSAASDVTTSDGRGTAPTHFTGDDVSAADTVDATAVPATADPTDSGPAASATAGSTQSGGSQTVTVSGVRIRKHIVTEMQTITIPVQHEVIEVVHEPLPDGQSAENEVPVNLDDVHVGGQNPDGSVSDSARHAAGAGEDSAGSTG